MNESERTRRLVARIRNDLKTLQHGQRNRMQARLLEDARETLVLLEAEVLKRSETLTTTEK